MQVDRQSLGFPKELREHIGLDSRLEYSGASVARDSGYIHPFNCTKHAHQSRRKTNSEVEESEEALVNGRQDRHHCLKPK